MIQQVKAGDKLTVIKVNSMASTTISEIMVDSIQDNRIIFTQKRKKYYLNEDSDMLVLKGHKLGITQGTWNDGGSCFLMNANCNIGGLDRESMIELLKTNINPKFNQWQKIYWFDGTSEVGDPIFVPRPMSENYLRYREEAEQNNIKAAGEINVGDFIYSHQKGSKLRDLNDMLKYHLMPDTHAKVSPELGKIVDIIEMTEEAFDSLSYSDSDGILKDKGGSFSDDVAEDRDIDNLSEFERETFYSHYTLIRTPSGRAITVDAQGYDYMRYTGLLPHYKTSMAADCEKATAIITKAENEKAEEKQIQKAEVERKYQQECKRVAKEYPFLTVTVDKYDQKVAANNLRILLKRNFPDTKFSVKKFYYDSYTVSWVDGPTVGQVTEITRLFRNEGFDGMTDSTYPVITPFNERYGGIGSISADRTVSEQHKEAELAMINQELGKSYQKEDYSPEHGEYVGTIIHQRLYKRDLTPAPEPKVKITPKAKPAVEVIPTEGIEIIDYSEKSFAVVGDTKPIKDTLKKLGGCFNGRLTCGAGWIFSKTKIEVVKQTLQIA